MIVSVRAKKDRVRCSSIALTLTLTLTPFLVVPIGIEPISSESESEILSIELRDQSSIWSHPKFEI